MLDARQRACLRAIGVDLWVRRAEAGGQVPGSGEVGVEHRGAEIRQPVPASNIPGRASAVLRRETALDEALVPDPAPVSPESRPSAADPVSTLDWAGLKNAVANCRACSLHETRTQTVFGVGAPDARLMVIGEAPGVDEDRQGEPFVGRAGQLLNAMLAAIGFDRDQVYIANIVKCRPPGNRDPHAEEAVACRTFLLRQIELIQPRLILSVGRVSAHNLLGTDESVGRLRGRTHRLDPGEVPVIVTYHPAYLLRRPQEKAKSWQDLQAAWRLLKEA